MKARDAIRLSDRNRLSPFQQMLAGMLSSVVVVGAVKAADTCKEVATLQAGGRSMISLPSTLIPPRGEKPEAHDLAAGWQCTAEDQGGDWLLTCHSSWSTEVKLVYELTIGLAKELRACAGSDWRQRTVRLNAQKATSFLYRNGENTEFETSIEIREAPSSIDIGAALGVPHKPTMETRVELTVIRLATARYVSVASSSDSDPLCPKIREIVLDAASDFRNIRGAPSDSSWVALKTLPGANECSVSDSSDYASYQCVQGIYPNRGALRADQIGLNNRINACLGQAWETARRPRGNGMWIYSISSKGSNVEVDIRGRLRKEKPTLLIEVDREK